MLFAGKSNSELGAEEVGGGSGGEVEEVWSEIGGSDFDAAGLVAFEHGGLLLSEGVVEDVHVVFVVEEEGAVVKVGGTGDDEVIVDDDEFAVHHGGGELPDADSGLEEIRVGESGGGAAEGDIDVGAGGDDFDPHAASGGVGDGLPEGGEGDEVGMFDEEGVAGGGDGEEVGLGDGVALFEGCAEDELGLHGADGGEGREVVGSTELFAGEFAPVVDEDVLELGDGGAADFVLGIAPVVRGVGMAHPSVGEAGAAGVGKVAIRVNLSIRGWFDTGIYGI